MGGFLFLGFLLMLFLLGLRPSESCCLAHVESPCGPDALFETLEALTPVFFSISLSGDASGKGFMPLQRGIGASESYDLVEFLKAY